MYREMYIFHQSYYLNKIKYNKEVLINIKEQLKDTIDILENYKSKLYIYGITINVDLDNITVPSKLRKKAKFMKHDTREEMKLRYLVIKIYNLCANYRKYLSEYKFYIEVKNIPYHIFKHIIKSNNEINQLDILRGKKWYLGASCGYIQIMRTKRRYCNVQGDEVKNINWYESNNVLFEISKQQEESGLHSIYSSYKNGLIELRKFRDKMRDYVYSKENPNLPKYIVYMMNDIYNWWYWVHRNKYIPNMTNYTFIPTSYNNYEDRRYETILNKVNNITDIINNNNIGNLDKVSILCSYDPNYSLKFDIHE